MPLQVSVRLRIQPQHHGYVRVCPTPPPSYAFASESHDEGQCPYNSIIHHYMHGSLPGHGLGIILLYVNATQHTPDWDSRRNLTARLRMNPWEQEETTSVQNATRNTA